MLLIQKKKRKIIYYSRTTEIVIINIFMHELAKIRELEKTIAANNKNKLTNQKDIT